MALDEDRVRFKGKAISAAIRVGASIEDEAARPFFDRIYKEWQESQLSLDDSERWLDSRFSQEFKSFSTPPKWVEEEPAWPFLDGKPMVFLTQCNMGDEELAASELSPGETVYLFGGRQSVVDGRFKMVYRTVSQFRD